MTSAPDPSAAIEVTVLMPCLNEAETLAVCVDKARTCLAELGVHGEVLVSDNGSSDGSQQIAAAHGARVVHAPIRGYGGALICGIQAARGTFIIMADADDSYDLTNLGPFIEQLRAGNDLVMGNRFKGGIAPGAMPPLHRYLGNPVLSQIGRSLFRLQGVGDFHCGIRGFRKDRIQALQLRMPGMEFASELVVRAAIADYRIAEVPTTLQPDGRSRKPHLRTWRDGWRHLRFLMVYAPTTMLALPGAILSILGLAASIALLPGPLRLGSVQFNNAALVYTCLTFLVGVQLLLVGGCAKLYTHPEATSASGPGAGRMAFWRRMMRLETLITVGLAMIAAGVGGTISSLQLWHANHFGALDAQHVIHVVVPSATIIATGVTALFTGLLASLITLDRTTTATTATTTEETTPATPVLTEA